jgi:hypothetical protein
VAALAQVTDFREHALLTRIWFRAETESEPDIAHPLPAGALVPQRIPRAFPDGLALPLRDRCHDGDDQAAGG